MRLPIIRDSVLVDSRFPREKTPDSLLPFLEPFFDSMVFFDEEGEHISYISFSLKFIGYRVHRKR